MRTGRSGLFRRSDFVLAALAMAMAGGPGCSSCYRSGSGCDDASGTECRFGETRECVGPGLCEGTARCIGGELDWCECNVDGGRQDGSIDGGPDAGLDDAAPPDASLGPHTFPGRDYVCPAGESPVCSTAEPARSDEDRTVVLDAPLGGGSLTFVVNSLVVQPIGSGMSLGFNLDGLDSGDGSAAGATTCEETRPDFPALLDPLHIGVDNAQSGLVPTVEGLYDPAECPGGATEGCIDATIVERMAEGSLLLLMYIEDVDSLVDDPEVTVRFYLGRSWGGGMPDLDAEGRILPNQMFEITLPLAEEAVGDIFDGRLRVQLPALDFPEGTADGLFLVGNDLEDVEVRFDVSADRLTSGSLGGHAAVEDLVTVISSPSPGSEDAVRAVVEAVSDVAPSAGDDTVCTRISVGYALDAVWARISH